MTEDTLEKLKILGFSYSEEFNTLALTRRIDGSDFQITVFIYHNHLQKAFKNIIGIDIMLETKSVSSSLRIVQDEFIEGSDGNDIASAVNSAYEKAFDVVGRFCVKLGEMKTLG